MSTSSLWTYSFVMGSNSAVGTASKNSLRTGSLNSVSAHAINFLRSLFEMLPMGLMSAELQSYFVKYP